jgi:hypothetical protein
MGEWVLFSTTLPSAPSFRFPGSMWPVPSHSGLARSICFIVEAFSGDNRRLGGTVLFGSLSISLSLCLWGSSRVGKESPT